MKNFLLKSPHWTLFIVLFVIPIILSISVYVYFIFEMMSYTSSNTFVDRYDPANQQMPEFIQERFGLLIWIYVPSLISIFLSEKWMYHFSHASNNLLPENLKVNLKTFNLLIFIPAIVFGILIIGMFFGFKQMAFSGFQEPNVGLIVFIVIVSIILYLVMLFATFYCFVMAAKAYKTAIEKKSVTFGDFVGEFFLLWFPIVGVWIMQPKINQIANGTLYEDSFENTTNHLVE